MAKRGWLQFGIRELLAAATVLALAIMLFKVTRENRELRGRHERILSKTHLRVWGPGMLEEVSNGSSIGLAGTLFHGDNQRFTTSPTLSVRLIDAATNAVVSELKKIELVRNESGHDFGFTLNLGRIGPKPGVHLVVVEAWDGSTSISEAATAMRIVDWRTYYNSSPTAETSAP